MNSPLNSINFSSNYSSPHEGYGVYEGKRNLDLSPQLFQSPSPENYRIMHLPNLKLMKDQQDYQSLKIIKNEANINKSNNDFQNRPQFLKNIGSNLCSPIALHSNSSIEQGLPQIRLSKNNYENKSLIKNLLNKRMETPNYENNNEFPNLNHQNPQKDNKVKFLGYNSLIPNKSRDLKYYQNSIIRRPS